MLLQKCHPYMVYNWYDMKIFLLIFCSLFFRIYITKNVENNWMNIYCHTLSKCDLLAIGGAPILGIKTMIYYDLDVS